MTHRQTGLKRRNEWSRGPSWADSSTARLCLQASPLMSPVGPLASHPCHLPQVITVFSLVEVVLRAEATALKYSAILKPPGTEGLLGAQDTGEECDEDAEQD